MVSVWSWKPPEPLGCSPHMSTASLGFPALMNSSSASGNWPWNINIKVPFSRAVLILPSLDLVQQQQQTDLVLQVHGVLQVHLGDLVFTRQTSQVEGEAEEAVEGSGSSD